MHILISLLVALCQKDIYGFILVEYPAPCFMCKEPTNLAEINYQAHLHPQCENLIHANLGGVKICDICHKAIIDSPEDEVVFVGARLTEDQRCQSLGGCPF